MTSVPSKWLIELEANSELRELHASLLGNIGRKRMTINEDGSPEQRKKKVKITRALPSAPSEPEPTSSLSSPNKETGPGKQKAGRTRRSRARPSPRKASATYTFNRARLPGIVSRAKEFVKKWHEPKLPKLSPEAKEKQFRTTCNITTRNHSSGAADFVKPTNTTFIAMEFRKSLVRHDWGGVKKLLNVFLRSNNLYDRVAWKMILTTLYYYPGAEPALREFIERNRKTFVGSELLHGLLEINGMERFSDVDTSKRMQESGLGAMNDNSVIVLSDGNEDSD